MMEFLDGNGSKVFLAFSKHSFAEAAMHVLVICQYGDKWLLTDHKQRGLEFPGGKLEQGESLEDAAKREVFEETGALLADLVFLGEYKVVSTTNSFIKAIFWGQVERLKQSKHYFETNGPVVIQGDLEKLRFGREYSFIMKDQVIGESLKFINAQQKK